MVVVCDGVVDDVDDAEGVGDPLALCVAVPVGVLLQLLFHMGLCVRENDTISPPYTEQHTRVLCWVKMGMSTASNDLDTQLRAL